jgi:hypothetical protein
MCRMVRTCLEIDASRASCVSYYGSLDKAPLGAVCRFHHGGSPPQREIGTYYI